MKTVMKTESVAEFLARGGKVTKVAMNVSKRAYSKKFVEKAVDNLESEIDMSALPEALRIKYGVK